MRPKVCLVYVRDGFGLRLPLVIKIKSKSRKQTRGESSSSGRRRRAKRAKEAVKTTNQRAPTNQLQDNVCTCYFKRPVVVYIFVALVTVSSLSSTFCTATRNSALDLRAPEWQNDTDDQHQLDCSMPVQKSGLLPSANFGLIQFGSFGPIRLDGKRESRHALTGQAQSVNNTTGQQLSTDRQSGQCLCLPCKMIAP